jgi:2-polyprenyl-6-hydroxyphenyl methylase/3-demethylubiquinone-9 3-methyltransferase
MARTRKYLQWKIAQSAELRWWKNYLKDKDPDDYKKEKLAYWKKVLSPLGSIVSQVDGLDILDAGCGPAGIFMALDQARVDAVDPLLEEYHHMLKHFDKGDYPWVRFFESPLESFDLQKQYDIVFCMNVINHVADIALCYQKLSGWIRPGGLLVISIDAHNTPGLKHVFRWLPGDILHPHQFDLQDYRDFLGANQLVLQQEETLNQGLLFNHVLQIAQKQG